MSMDRHRARQGRLFAGAALTFLLGGIGPASVLADEPAPGVAEGSRIGNVVKTAITTAFPEVSSIIKLIFGDRANDNASVKKADLSKQLEEVRLKSLAEAQTRLTPMNDVAEELFQVNTFLVPAVRAQVALAGLRAHLGAAAPDWGKVTSEWKIASDYVDKIGNVSDGDMKKIKTVSVQVVLSNIRAEAKETNVRVAGAIGNKSRDEVLRELSLLEMRLRDVATISTVEFGQVRQGLADLAAWAKAPAGAGQKVPFEATLLNDLKGRYNLK
jgi:hypothetical protein